MTANRLVDSSCHICVFKAKRCKHIYFVIKEILHEKYPKIYYDNKSLDSLFKYLPGYVSTYEVENEKEIEEEK